MNENEPENDSSFFRDIAKDDRVQRAAAGVIIAVVGAGAANCRGMAKRRADVV